jgi:hypothetical protein
MLEGGGGWGTWCHGMLEYMDVESRFIPQQGNFETTPILGHNSEYLKSRWGYYLKSAWWGHCPLAHTLLMAMECLVVKTSEFSI